MKLKIIAGSKFTWQNSFNCNMEVTPFEVDYKTNKFFFRKPWKIIGYTFNPYWKRECEIGVMFENEEDFTQLWCHCRLDLIMMMGYDIKIPKALRESEEMKPLLMIYDRQMYFRNKKDDKQNDN